MAAILSWIFGSNIFGRIYRSVFNPIKGLISPSQGLIGIVYTLFNHISRKKLDKNNFFKLLTGYKILCEMIISDHLETSSWQLKSIQAIPTWQSQVSFDSRDRFIYSLYQVALFG
jgi:hypothetical protein